MKTLGLFLIIWLNSIFIFAQCEQFEKKVSTLIEEKKEIQKNLDNSIIAYDKLMIKLKKEEKERVKYQRMYYEQVRKNDSIMWVNRMLEKKMGDFKREKDRINQQIQKLEQERDTQSKDYTRLLLARDSLNLVLSETRRDKDELQTSFDERTKTMTELKKNIDRLEDEAEDKISLRPEFVSFMNKEYLFRSNILFVEFNRDTSDVANASFLNNKDDKYALNRLGKLVSKYDYKVRLKLIGTSTEPGLNSDKAEKLARDRAQKIVTFLSAPERDFPLEPESINIKEYIYSDKIGVFLQVIKK